MLIASASYDGTARHWISVSQRSCAANAIYAQGRASCMGCTRASSFFRIGSRCMVFFSAKGWNPVSGYWFTSIASASFRNPTASCFVFLRILGQLCARGPQAASPAKGSQGERKLLEVLESLFDSSSVWLCAPPFVGSLYLARRGSFGSSSGRSPNLQFHHFTLCWSTRFWKARRSAV